MYRVAVKESSCFRVVIPCLQEVQACFGIVIVTAVTEGVEVTDIVLVGNFITIRINNFVVAPRIVVIFYHSIAVIVNENK